MHLLNPVRWNKNLAAMFVLEECKTYKCWWRVFLLATLLDSFHTFALYPFHNMNFPNKSTTQSLLSEFEAGSISWQHRRGCKTMVDDRALPKKMRSLGNTNVNKQGKCKQKTIKQWKPVRWQRTCSFCRFDNETLIVSTQTRQEQAPTCQRQRVGNQWLRNHAQACLLLRDTMTMLSTTDRPDFRKTHKTKTEQTWNKTIIFTWICCRF